MPSTLKTLIVSRNDGLVSQILTTYALAASTRYVPFFAQYMPVIYMGPPDKAPSQGLGIEFLIPERPTCQNENGGLAVAVPQKRRAIEAPARLQSKCHSVLCSTNRLLILSLSS